MHPGGVSRAQAGAEVVGILYAIQDQQQRRAPEAFEKFGQIRLATFSGGTAAGHHALMPVAAQTCVEGFAGGFLDVNARGFRGLEELFTALALARAVDPHIQHAIRRLFEQRQNCVPATDCLVRHRRLFLFWRTFAFAAFTFVLVLASRFASCFALHLTNHFEIEFGFI